MKNKNKSFLILAVTLALGVILGALTSQLMIKHRLRHLEGMMHPMGFVRAMDHILELNEDQQSIVEEILKKHHQRFEKINQEHMISLKAMMDSLSTELKPHLTAEQLLRLDDMRSFRKHKGPWHPPHEGKGKRGHRGDDFPHGRESPPAIEDES